MHPPYVLPAREMRRFRLADHFLYATLSAALGWETLRAINDDDDEDDSGDDDVFLDDDDDYFLDEAEEDEDEDTADVFMRLATIGLIVIGWYRQLTGRFRPRLLKKAYGDPSTACWRTVKDSLDVRAWVLFLGVSPGLFQRILRDFEPRLPPVYQAGARRGRGRPPSLFGEGILALVLHWMRTSSADSKLQCAFGISDTAVSKYRALGLSILNVVLYADPRILPRFPTRAEVLVDASHHAAHRTRFVRRAPACFHVDLGVSGSFVLSW